MFTFEYTVLVCRLLLCLDNLFFKSNGRYIDYLSFTYTYLLTPWSRAPLEKLTGSAASQEIYHSPMRPEKVKILKVTI